MFNRFPLGRTLDEVHTSGGDLLVSDLAWAVWAHEGIDVRFHHLDMTSFDWCVWARERRAGDDDHAWPLSRPPP
jgi:hypothetical protein